MWGCPTTLFVSGTVVPTIVSSKQSASITVPEQPMQPETESQRNRNRLPVAARRLCSRAPPAWPALTQSNSHITLQAPGPLFSGRCVPTMSSSTSTSTGKSTGSTHTARPLPPGTVLGPDGKPCKICTSFRNWKPPTSANTKPTTPTTAATAGKKNTGDQGGAARAIASATATALAASSAGLGEGYEYDDDGRRRAAANCPPDVESLGRATWTFLHTTAAYYPDAPTPTQRAHMLQLLHALPQLYPCSHCAGDLGDRMRNRPPNVRSRAALSAWLCETHNEVNAMLGKPAFDCARVDERWKDGPRDGSCD